MGTVTLVVSEKGGVGKSTICSLLGLELAELSQRVLVIDNVPCIGALSTILGVYQNIIFDSSDIVNGNCKLNDAIYQSPFNHNLHLLPSPQNPYNKLSHSVIKQLINLLSSVYEHVIIDCPYDIIFDISFMSCIDNVLVVSDLNPISLRAAHHTKFIIKKCGLSNIRLVINNFSHKSLEHLPHYNNLDDIIDDTSIQLIAVIPKDDITILNIINGKCPNINSPIILAFKRLASRLIGVHVPISI